jgi:topoisomerase-4 subunit A
LSERKLLLLADVRDESAEDVRLVLEPRSRTVDPVMLMESLFRLTDLETRLPLNMNVLARGRVPMVLSLRGVLRQWLDHRKEVLGRRTRHRLAEIARRIEVLGGLLIAYLNLDEVIRIIREADEPKPALIARFTLTDVQAEAILNMRLRSLRRLEEMEIRREHDALLVEQSGLEALMASEDQQWTTIEGEIREVRKRFGKDTVLGKRRTDFADPPDVVALDLDQAMIEKEPVTVVCSDKGWIRAVKGHIADASALAYKEGDRGRFVFPATTTDKLLLLATNGKVFTLEASLLPGGRGHGEPVRLMIDLEENHDIADVFTYQPGRKLLRLDRRLRLHRAGRRGGCLHAQGQAGAQRDGAGGSQADRAGRRRHGRDRRREPQAAGLQARRGQRDDPRQGRHLAALRRRQTGRRACVQEG